MKKYLITSLKFIIPAAIIAWLLASVDRRDFAELEARHKDWLRLGTAFAFLLTAVCITFVRWYLLVRALHLRFRLRDAFRLGSMGFLLNFVSVGAVGGDLFKAFFIAREQPGRRTEAVATVIVDRVIGLFGLLLVASAAVLLSPHRSIPAVAALCNLTLLATGIAIVAAIVVLSPGFASGSLAEFLCGLPRIGNTLERLFASLRMYRRAPWAMLGIVVMSTAVHSLLVVAVYLVATALFDRTPSFAEHFIIVPLSMVAGGLPFTPAGLGSFEFAMDKLYEYVPTLGSQEVVGILVALAYRLVTVAVAAVGVAYYWSCRAEVREVMAQAELAQHEPIGYHGHET